MKREREREREREMAGDEMRDKAANFNLLMEPCHAGNESGN
jgi:hypothetical protein